jgi:signal transduction histidine kinase/ligand-binding sensor domain-containing protein/DNA-binding response OmpR family regulator
MRLAVITLLFVLQILVQQTLAQSELYKFRNYNTSNGLSDNQANCLFVDHKGFVWTSNLSGFNRFDGYSFQTVAPRVVDSLNNFPTNNIEQIFEDHQGVFWLKLYDNSVMFYNPKDDTFSRDHYLLRKITSWHISTVLVDRDSNLWIGTNKDGVYKYDTKADSVYHFEHSNTDSQSLRSNLITGLTTNNQGEILSINNTGIVEKIDKATGKAEFVIDFMKGRQLPENSFFNIFCDGQNDIWCYSRHVGSLFYYSPKSGRSITFSTDSPTFPLSENIVTTIIQDANGKIWVGTDHGGVNIIDKQDFSIHIVKSREGDDYSLSHNTITTLCRDASGGIWVGTYKGGVDYYHPNGLQFGLYKKNPFDNSTFPAKDVSCFAEDKEGNLWIGTNENGLIYFDRKNNTFKPFTHNPNNANSLSNNVIVSLLYDSKNRLWIGTYQGGLNMYDGRNFTHYKTDSNNPESISSNNVWHITEDSKNRLWIGTLDKGLDLFDPIQGRFTHYKEGQLNSVRSNYIQTIYETNNKQIWVGTSNGIDIFEPSSGRFSCISCSETDGLKLQNYTVTCIVEDKRGWMWIGSKNGIHCYDPLTKTQQVFKMSDGLSDNVITSVQIDNLGSIWAANRKGLTNIVPSGSTALEKTKFTFINYYTRDGLQGNEFNLSSGFKTRSGELVFGGMNGFNIFDPCKISNGGKAYDVFFTDFKIENNSVFPNQTIGNRIVLKHAISSTKQITLSYDQTNFSIHFSSFNYIHPEKIRYRYKLDGVNPDWIYTDATNRVAVYTNLDPGKYIFKVTASNDNGEWTGEVATINITIVPPFYATKWAYAVYFLILLSLILMLLKAASLKQKWKFQRMQEKLEHKRLLELEAMKTKFFTNVSHEFRTPLTLILTPLEKLIGNSPNNEHKLHLEIIKRNALRLQNLVNQLLDFRKLEQIKPSLNLWRGDIVAFLRETSGSFIDLSEAKVIKLSFESDVESYFVAFDRYKIEKILFNLLSNAFKFTPTNGKVSVHISMGNNGNITNPKYFDGREYLEIKVADSGVGIPSDQLNKVFDRFFQSDNTIDEHNQGSGIGLSIAKEFVMLHHGTIQAESTQGVGTTFIVRIPFSKDDTPALNETPISVNDEELEVDETAMRQDTTPSRPTILIVEDNKDLRLYLRSNFEKHYHIYEANDGQEGWQKCVELQPTLVVSDIMMPVMDGIELCRKIKNEGTTSHIPIILLTAKASLEHELEGLGAGADEYMSKPFSIEMLELKVKKLIENRKALQQKIQQKFEIAPGEIGITSLDEKFIQKTIKLVEEHMADPEFSVEELSQALAMSRSHLYNKLMALTGKSPIEFIRIMRLKRAAQLLEKSQQSVSTIAYEVGFNSTKYFAKYFREEFNVSPSEYAKKAKQE